VKIVIELLSILSIATKEVKRPQASELSRQDIPRSTLNLTFPQKYFPGNCLEGQILRTRSRGSMA
jgi:hypothetical protein